MRNNEIRTTKTGPNDAGLNQLLAEARMEERRGRADVFAAHLEKLAVHITRGKLSGTEAAELLRNAAETIQNEAQEVH
ncbi:DUF2732 domain-containing protein [Lelliottia amnigena]|uniref:DUF2732 domain-containing protein n=1 Tax=Lelliottia amnigena TaxID=61646 RepID=A0AAP2AH31_LELAM|nr:DUF2732 family protein [Lelliottia amnigena]MBL5901119.1 DUF2732 domain-containing protein [Lelliottia amnigena]MBL5937039.1 DUF2732 domain-containing protein [Lelliottia amnigena]